MTGWGWAACAGSVLVLGSLLGLVLYFLLGERAYRRGLLDGQHQAELTHGVWHPAISEGWNPSGIPRPRDRAPDHQLVTRLEEPARTIWPSFGPR